MKIIPIITLILILFSCNGQEESKQKIKNQSEMTTEKFDIETFNKNKVNNEYSFLLESGKKIEQMQAGDGESLIYIEYETPKDPELFYVYKEYHNNGVLKLKGERFKQGGKFQKGIWKKYNSNSSLSEEIDYDKPFKFTFEQLLELIKKEKDTINLFDKNTSIARRNDSEGTDWFITYRKEFGRREVIKVDGVTGEILERSFYPHEDN